MITVKVSDLVILIHDVLLLIIMLREPTFLTIILGLLRVTMIATAYKERKEEIICQQQESTQPEAK